MCLKEIVINMINVCDRSSMELKLSFLGLNYLSIIMIDRLKLFNFYPPIDSVNQLVYFENVQS